MKGKSIKSFILDILIPLAVMAIGAFALLDGALLNRYLTVVHFLIPAVTILLFGVCHLVLESKLLKVLVSVVIIVICLFNLFIMLFWNTEYFETDELGDYEGAELVDRYAELYEVSELLPDIGAVARSERSTYYHYRAIYSFFECETHTVISKYGAEDYVDQLAWINDSYTFRTEAIVDDEYTCLPYADIDGFHFRVIDDPDEADMYDSYPKKVLIVGTNDETSEIAYIHFYDFDLDYIPSLEDFILEDCGWERISDERNGGPLDDLLDRLGALIPALAD